MLDENEHNSAKANTITAQRCRMSLRCEGYNKTGTVVSITAKTVISMRLKLSTA